MQKDQRPKYQEAMQKNSEVLYKNLQRAKDYKGYKEIEEFLIDYFWDEVFEIISSHKHGIAKDASLIMDDEIGIFVQISHLYTTERIIINFIENGFSLTYRGLAQIYADRPDTKKEIKNSLNNLSKTVGRFDKEYMVMTKIIKKAIEGYLLKNPSDERIVCLTEGLVANEVSLEKVMEKAPSLTVPSISKRKRLPYKNYTKRQMER